MATDVEFWNACRALRGARFRHHGRTSTRMDCIGMPFVASATLYNPVFPFLDYDRVPDEAVVRKATEDRCDLRDWNEWNKIGRLLLLRVEKMPIHFGVMGPDRGWAAVMGARWEMREVKPEHVDSVWLVRGIVPTV